MDFWEAGLLDAVRKKTADPGAQILSLDRAGYDDGFADAVTGGDGVVQCSGIARTDRGEEAFEIVAKTCASHPQGADPDSWLYWKREPLAYVSGLLNDLPAGLAAPTCHGVLFPDPQTAVIYMDAIPGGTNEWSLDTYSNAARSLGRFNGAYLNGHPFQIYPWMVPSRAILWLEEARQTLDALIELKNDPVISRWLRGDNFGRTQALWDGAGKLRAALRELPRCLCHHDAFRRNLMASPNDDPKGNLVAIDWAFVGPGVVGEEIAVTVGVSLQFMEVGMGDARRLEKGVFDGYLAGLRASGWNGSERDVRLGFAASTALMLALGALGPWLPLLRDPGFEPIIEKIVGVDREQFLERLAELQTYVLDLGEEALSLA